MRPTLLLLLVVAAASSGCAVPIAGAAIAALGGGTNAAVHAGTEYATNGVVYRTFSLPLDQLRLVLGDALARMEIAIIRDETKDGERRIEARAHDREVKIQLEPVTRTVTRLRLLVTESSFRRDRATASEIIAQTERQATVGARASPLAGLNLP